MRGGQAVQGYRPEPVALAQPQYTELGLADAHRIRQHGLEHGLKLAGRAGDDAQHLRGGGLLVERLAQLVEQARVLDRYHRLIGEAPHQLKLILLKGSHLAAIDNHHTDRLSFSRERREYLRSYRQVAQCSGDFAALIRERGAAVLKGDLSIVEEAAHRWVRRFERGIGQRLPKPDRGGTCRTDEAKDVSLETPEIDVGGIEHPGSGLGDRVEGPPAVLGSTGDDAKDIGRREILDQLDLLLAERPHLLAECPQVAKQCVVLEQRNAQRGSRPADVGRYQIEWIAFEVASLRTQIRRLHGLLGAGQRNDVGAAIRLMQPFRVEK